MVVREVAILELETRTYHEFHLLAPTSLARWMSASVAVHKDWLDVGIETV